MSDDNKSLSVKGKEAAAQKLWLTYFNETLFAQGVISEAERNRMKAKINTRTPSLR